MNSDLITDIPNKINMNHAAFQKMMFIMNALENGWKVKKNQDSYIFTKKHENKREIFQDDYLKKFIENNIKISEDLH